MVGRCTVAVGPFLQTSTSLQAQSTSAFGADVSEQFLLGIDGSC